jgi:hypothetical protein
VNSAQPVRLALFPSGKFAVLIVIFHAVAALCFLTVLTGWLGIAAASLLIALGAAAAWDRALLRSGRAPRSIEIRPTGEAFCLLANGDSVAVEAHGGSAVTRHWVALRLHSPSRRSLLVAAGMLPAESFRRLRLWALWGKLPGVAPLQLSARS